MEKHVAVRNLRNALGSLKNSADLGSSNLNSGKGDPIGCVMLLQNYCMAESMLAWFDTRDLTLCKQWAYVTARMQQIEYKLRPTHFQFRSYKLLYPLLSNNNKVINWFMSVDFYSNSSFFHGMMQANDHQSFHFHSFQSILALRGDWAELERRCLLILNDPPVKEKKYLIDHQFFLALSRGDLTGMELALNDLTSPRIAKVRNVEQAFAFEKSVISCFAVIYAKIALRHGFHVQIRSELVPSEWLATVELAQYNDPFNFMKSFPIV
jgi:Immunity protein 49